MKESAPANPLILHWARLERKLSPGEVVKLSKLSRLTEPRLAAIERGEVEPSISELLKFSKIYIRPFAFFFSPKTPPALPEIPDQRTGTGHGADTYGDLSLAISRAYEVQNFIFELAESNKAPLPSLPNPPLEARRDPEQLSGWMRRQLGISKMFTAKLGDSKTVLEQWIARVETLGPMILQETFSPKDASAFSIGTLNPPVIVLCFKDSERRRLFSLFHELAHVLLRQSAICELSFGRIEGEERFCDKFSASFLMPREEVEALSLGFDDLDRLSQKISSFSGASVESAFLRLVDLKIATMEDYWERKPVWELGYSDWLKAQKAKKGGPNPNPAGTAIRKGGRTLSTFVSDAFQAGQISRAEASRIMRLPAKEIPQMIKQIK